MNKFENNTISLFGHRGKAWLESLPKIVEDISRRYGLTELTPVNNLSYNYVLSGFQGNQAIILKLGLDTTGLKREAAALKAFSDFGAVKILAEDENLLILERAIPSHSLKSCSLEGRGKAISIACNVMKRLHQAPLPRAGTFPHIKDWLMALDKEWDIPALYLQKARQLRDNLLRTEDRTVLLHGDLHYDNILQNGNQWVVIDPKGVIGYPINETWAFVMDMERDTEFIANFFGFKLQEVRDWYFVRLILATCWNLEDNIDAGLFMNLARKAYKLVTK